MVESIGCTALPTFEVEDGIGWRGTSKNLEGFDENRRTLKDFDEHRWTSKGLNELGVSQWLHRISFHAPQGAFLLLNQGTGTGIPGSNPSSIS
ncbi:hypothetical protein D3C73_519140 [compost metagenome]